MIAKFEHDDDTEAEYTPVAEILPGQVVQLPDGRAAINNSNNALAANKPARMQTVGLITLAIASALVIDDGDDVHIASDAVAATGGFKVGKARRGGSPDGSTTIVVSLNAPV